jgi:hypothetical protein
MEFIDYPCNKTINMKYSEIKLYLNMVGGHALIIDLGNGKILKSSAANEIKFYENHKNTKFQIYELFPKYFGMIVKSQQEYSVIENFIRLCETFFIEFIRGMDLDNFDINIEQDEELNKKLECVLNEDECRFHEESNSHLNSFSNSNSNFSFSLQTLKEELENMNPDKLKWILFWFVKWRNSFFNLDFIILEDLTHNITHPAILDMKLGFKMEFCNKSKNHNPKPNLFYECGLRIMGMQVFIISF